jgi:MarR family transcriptional regulator, 2-MHQ and catechol-resistance regulon repressor
LYYDVFVKKARVKIQSNISEQAFIRLMRLGDKFWRASDERFSRWELMDNHYNVLRILNGAGEPLRQIEIGRRMLSTRANVTKLIDTLEKRGLVTRLTCEDRRVNLIDLTAEGSKFLEDTLAEVLQFAEEAMKPLTRQEQKTLFELLGKLLSD